MRPDMAKVLVERPRAGGRWHTNEKKLFRYEKDENYPLHLGMKKLWADRKELSDNLNPLYKFLEKSVGKPWDSVYSDISKNLDRSTVSGFHVWSHVKSYVEEHVIRMEGKTPIGLNEIEIHNSFYVHPVTRLLCKARNRRYHYRTVDHLASVRKFLSDTEMLYKHNNIWYKATIEPVQDVKIPYQMWIKNRFMKDEVRSSTYFEGAKPVQLFYQRSPGPDAFHTKAIDSHRMYGKEVRATSKRQLNKKDKKRYNLI